MMGKLLVAFKDNQDGSSCFLKHCKERSYSMIVTSDPVSIKQGINCPFTKGVTTGLGTTMASCLVGLYCAVLSAPGTSSLTVGEGHSYSLSWHSSWPDVQSAHTYSTSWSLSRSLQSRFSPMERWASSCFTTVISWRINARFWVGSRISVCRADNGLLSNVKRFGFFGRGLLLSGYCFHHYVIERWKKCLFL